jgi:glycosyltransferase involved in cell wall biosynthesis
VYPSRAEGFGIPPLEAGALRVPVICSRSTAMESYGFFGDYHIDPYNLAELTAKLSAILETPPPMTRLELISGIIRRDYSWNRAAEALYNAVRLP